MRSPRSSTRPGDDHGDRRARPRGGPGHRDPRPPLPLRPRRATRRRRPRPVRRRRARSLAIVGPSGSGKSTLVNLLLRFWDYDEGEIRIGGRDLRDYRVDEIRRLLGVVPQDVHLFDATIRDNLAVADADVTDERIEEACRMAQVHGFIETLPAGYETRVGENGVLLSGGERQRLAIARAIIKDAPILILDEATANLDVATEAALLDSLAPFMAGRTTIVISHRASVAARTDRLLVLG